MKKKPHSIIHSVFLMITGVVVITTAITTVSVMAATPAKTTSDPTIVSIQGNNFKYKWPASTPKALPYYSLPASANSVLLTTKASTKAVGGEANLEYAYVVKTTAFSDTPTAGFSLKNKVVKDAAGEAADWSAQNTYTLAVTPEMAGKWVTVYVFIRDSVDKSGFAQGLPQMIDEVGAMVFKMPAVIGSGEKNTVVGPVAFTNAETWKTQPAGTEYNLPKLNRLIGVRALVTKSEKPVEITRMKILFTTTKPYKGSFGIWLLTQAPNDQTAPALSVAGATTTIGVGIVNTAPACAKAVTTPCKTYTADIEFPIGRNIVVDPKKPLVLGFTADNLNSQKLEADETEAKFNANIISVAWREVGVKDRAVLDSNVNTLISFVYKPLWLNAIVPANAPSGFVTADSEQIIAKFAIQAPANSVNLPTQVNNLTFSINSNIAVASLDRKFGVYKGENTVSANKLAGGYFSYFISGAKQSSKDNNIINIVLDKPLVIEAGTSQVVTVVGDTVDAKSGDTLTIDLKDVGASIEGHYLSVTTPTAFAKGKTLKY